MARAGSPLGLSLGGRWITLSVGLTAVQSARVGFPFLCGSRIPGSLFLCPGPALSCLWPQFPCLFNTVEAFPALACCDCVWKPSHSSNLPP